MSSEKLKILGNEIWSNNSLKDILTITGNAIEAIIALKICYYNLSLSSADKLIIGNVNIQSLQTERVNNHICTINCGTITIKPYFKNFMDYEPYTDVQIYLPYIGIKPLRANDVIDADIEVKYNIDVLTGLCLARIFITKQYKNTRVKALLYQFNGNCDISIPISAQNNNNILTGFTSTVMGTINKQPEKIVGSLVNMKQNVDVQRSGNLNSALGMFGYNIPYLIITRDNVSIPTSYSMNIGNELNQTNLLSNIKGFTQILEIFINNFTGTQQEYEELLKLLKTGVVF